MKRVAVFGATGSIGGSALDVIQRHPDRFQATVLSAHRQTDALLALCERHRPELAIIAEGILARFRGGQYGSDSSAGNEFEQAVEVLADAALERTEGLG